MKISVQNGGVIGFWSNEKTYEMIREAGFEGIDWNLDLAWNNAEIRAKKISHCIFEDSVDEIVAYYQNELDAIHKNGLTIVQAHAPFPAYVPGFPEFFDYAVGVYKQCIRFCDRIGVKNLVIHGITLSWTDKTQTPETIREMNYRLYESLIPVLQETNVTVCLENLFARHDKQLIEGVCSVPEEAIEYIDTLNQKAGKECFGLCLDTGHLNLLGKNQVTYIKKLGSRIKALHVHDNNGDADSHLAPYTGSIIWKDVINALKEVNYSGDFNFETFRQVELFRVDPEMVPIWLKTIHDIGAEFVKKLEA